MPYKSAKQSRYMHSQHPEIAKRWDAEKKYKISTGKLKGSLGEMDPDTNRIKIDVSAHKKKGKIDRAELASTIKHEIMHVEKPKATEKEVYKATRKTKISPQEQNSLIAKLRHKKSDKPGDMFNRFQEKKHKLIANNNQSISKIDRVAIMGMV